ncbi:hypothetical protein [Chryseobacterium sp. ERMR1:04]|uniref:hypothetical protein n=1 Tax=Chryseobacterium sp. ERMR1:04 TaxID=1705393 RepID=UPI0006C89E8A|nr:hypothetical protein [Chryseobacterium sp. ERMR1:04]KPH15013.1 hypothetical protein AMQ68_06300 [Chryseobacterium sp. ERMR1:04]
MSIPLDKIYSYFKANKFPTQQQFEDSWSSFWHKDEVIIPVNTATVDDYDESGNISKLGNVYTKNQSNDMFMSYGDYTDNNGNILAEKIEALGLTTLIEAVETTISNFADHSGSYKFEDNDFIAIPDSSGNFSLYLFKGGAKTDKTNYLPTGISNVTIGMVEGLQAALNTKMNKPSGNGSFFIKGLGSEPVYAPISPVANYLLSWDGSDFKGSNVYYNAGKLGVDTASPTEMFHLNNGRIRSKAIVLDENTETLINQITYFNKKLLFTDGAGTKKTVLTVEDLSTEFLKLPSILTSTQKEQFGIDWNSQYSNGSLNVYSITPTVMKNNHVVRYLVLQGLNLNVNPTTTSIKFIPIGNAIGIGEINCLGFQTFADGKSMIVSIYGDSLQPNTQYNLMVRITSPTVQVHRTTSFVNVVSNIDSIDINTLTWETRAFTAGQEGNVLTTNGGLFSYNSNTANKVYAYEPNIIVAAAKSNSIFDSNTNFYLEINMSLSQVGTNSYNDIYDFYGYLGLLQSNIPISLTDNSFLRVINSSTKSGQYQSVLVWNNILSTATRIEPGYTNQLNANIIIMRTGNIYTQFLTIGSVTIIQSISSTTEAISLSLAVSNGTTQKTINGSIVQAFTF